MRYTMRAGGLFHDVKKGSTAIFARHVDCPWKQGPRTGLVEIKELTSAAMIEAVVRAVGRNFDFINAQMTHERAHGLGCK